MEEGDKRKQKEEVPREEVTLQLKEVLHEEVKPIEQDGMVLREEVSETKQEGKPLTKEIKEPEHGHEGVSEKQHGGEEPREEVNENQQEEERSEVVERGARAAEITSKSEELSEREQGGEVLSEVREIKSNILIEEDTNGEEQTEIEKQAELEGEILGSEVKECREEEEEVLCEELQQKGPKLREEVKETKHVDERVSENQQEEVTSEAVEQVRQTEETQSNTKHSMLAQEDEIQPREEEKEFVHKESETGEKEQDREELGERDGQTKQEVEEEEIRDKKNRGEVASEEVEEEEIRDKKNRGEVASEEVVGTKEEIQIEEREQEGEVHSEERENEEEGEEEERRLSEEEEQSRGKEQGGEEGQIDQEFGIPSEGEKIARGDVMEIVDRDDENPEKEHEPAEQEGEVVREVKETQLSEEKERPRVKEQNGEKLGIEQEGWISREEEMGVMSKEEEPIEQEQGWEYLEEKERPTDQEVEIRNKTHEGEVLMEEVRESKPEGEGLREEVKENEQKEEKLREETNVKEKEKESGFIQREEAMLDHSEGGVILPSEGVKEIIQKGEVLRTDFKANKQERGTQRRGKGQEGRGQGDTAPLSGDDRDEHGDHACLPPGAQTAPDHLYNVLLVGDSSVGKTSFIKRLKDGEFRSDHCATVGLDSCIHTLLIGDRRFVLQLWDTAGQERYHSITKQVFRKADGVVVMYDITSAQSFTAVRYWLTCIQEGAGDEVVVVLLANKSDSNARRAVPTHEGERLAQENRILFHECSAASGYNVTESMINLARQLKEQEEGLTGSDSEKKRVELQETQPKKKSGCC
ncbi:golgin subfamily A member 6-like protein 22 [Huso huso]|uniref:Golgin subfamily A member 6-like protein 22 n=1 Tax=Huso huso TaxID=61971 RepID=A0ABR0YHT9_HUSHU